MVEVPFYYQKFTATQKRYSTFERELQAAYLATIHFKPFIESRNVTLFTDHKPLESAFRSSKPAKSDKQQRYLSVLAEYIADVKYICGKDNIVADCLSRETMAIKVDPCDLPALAAEPLQDSEIQSLSDKLKSFPIGSHEIWCDVSQPYPRPYVPTRLRQNIFDSLHNISHPGVKGSLKLIKSRYYWPCMDKNIRVFARNCESCQQSKIVRHTKSKVTNFSLPSERFQTVHLDLVGPLPPAKQFDQSYTSPYRYLLTCIDRATKWVEAVPLCDISAKSVACAFMNTWISRFGVPLYVVTDRGQQFESHLFKELSTLTGFHRLRTTSYHPQSNGLVERVHRTLKTAIIARKQNWVDAYPIVLLGIRNSQINDFSPFSAVTGSNLMFPRPLIETESTAESFDDDKIKQLFNQMKSINLDNPTRINDSKSYIPKDLKKCSHVWVRVDRVKKPLEAPYTGPFEVIERHDKFFILLYPNDSHQSVSIDRLKPATIRVSNNEVVNEDNSPSEGLSNGHEEEPDVTRDTYTTRSGRKVKFRL